MPANHDLKLPVRRISRDENDLGHELENVFVDKGSAGPLAVPTHRRSLSGGSPPAADREMAPVGGQSQLALDLDLSVEPRNDPHNDSERFRDKEQESSGTIEVRQETPTEEG